MVISKNIYILNSFVIVQGYQMVQLNYSSFLFPCLSRIGDALVVQNESFLPVQFFWFENYEGFQK